MFDSLKSNPNSESLSASGYALLLGRSLSSCIRENPAFLTSPLFDCGEDVPATRILWGPDPYRLSDPNLDNLGATQWMAWRLGFQLQLGSS